MSVVENVDFGLFHASKMKQSSNILYDIKILYDLESKKTESFTILANDVLGTDRTEKYRSLSEKAGHFLKSYSTCGIDTSKIPFCKLFPKQLALDAEKERNNLVQELFNAAKEKEFYQSLFPVLKTLSEISQHPVFVDLDSIANDSGHYCSSLRKNTKDGKLFLKFNPVGAKTGRLSFVKGTLNFYTIPKNLRKAIVAPEHYNIVQLDFKSFQPRLAIFCTSSEEFKAKFVGVEDIYSIFPGDREENKIAFISWMFSKRRNKLFETEAAPILDLRKKLYTEAQTSGKLTTKFGRHIYYHNEEENVVLQNYVTANEVDAMLTTLVGVHQILKETRSRIITPFHDCILLYVHEDEMKFIEPIKDKMENENSKIFGSKFPVSVKVGKNFEELFTHN